MCPLGLKWAINLNLYLGDSKPTQAVFVSLQERVNHNEKVSCKFKGQIVLLQNDPKDLYMQLANKSYILILESFKM